MTQNCWILLVCLWHLTAAAAAGERGLVVVRDPAGQEVGLYAESHALVVGVSDYQNGWPRLPGVQDDLAAVEQTLQGHGFEVRVVRDPPDKDALEAAFEDFILDHGLEPQNRLLFYFAGHGHTHKPPYASDDPEEWMGYLVARDAPPPEQDQQGFLRHAVSMKRFEGLAEQIEAKHALFLFDSCFSGTVFALSRARPHSISYKTARPVRQFISSGSADETVPDVSVFRRQFVAALEGEADGNGDLYVTGAELGAFLQDRVINYTRSAQHPQYGKIRHPRLDKGDFVFALPGPPPPPGQAPLPPPPVRWEGNLQVNVNVPATVYLNDEHAGDTQPDKPLNRPGVPAGRAAVRVEAPGYQPATQRVQVRRGEWTQLVFDLLPLQEEARLTVRSNVYGDKVYIDGQEMGSTRLDVTLTPGRHTVRVEKEGYLPYEASVELEAGRDAVMRASLERKTVAVERSVTVPSDDLLSMGVYDVVFGSGFDELLLGGTVTSDRQPGAKQGTLGIALLTVSGQYAYRVRTSVEGNRLYCTIFETDDAEYYGQSFVATVTRSGNQYFWQDNAGRKMTLKRR